MMMAVEPTRGSLIKATELIHLGRSNIIEGAHQSRVKYSAGQAMAQKIGANLALTICEQCRTVRC
jgi:hypothetical protein